MNGQTNPVQVNGSYVRGAFQGPEIDHHRRKYVRIRIRLGTLPPARMSFLKPIYLEPFNVEICDVCPEGMKVASREIVPLNFEFDLDFALPGKTNIHAKARAIRNATRNGFYEAGIVFTEMEETVRESLLFMTIDYQCCEKRIQEKTAEICLKNCRFMHLCQKAEKRF